MKLKPFFLLLLFIFSCKSHQNTLYEFDPGKLDENKITLSEIADDITYVPLDNIFPISLIYKPRYFINNSIYNELGKGIFSAATKQKYLDIINTLVEDGAEGMIFGCTEITILIKQTNCTVPVFDKSHVNVNGAITFDI